MRAVPGTAGSSELSCHPLCQALSSCREGSLQAPWGSPKPARKQESPKGTIQTTRFTKVLERRGLAGTRERAWGGGRVCGRKGARPTGGCRGELLFRDLDTRSLWLHFPRDLSWALVALKGRAQVWAHLALCCVAHSPHGRDHGQRPCGLSGSLLPRHRLISKGTITARRGAGGLVRRPGRHDS